MQRGTPERRPVVSIPNQILDAACKTGTVAKIVTRTERRITKVTRMWTKVASGDRRGLEEAERVDVILLVNDDDTSTCWVDSLWGASSKREREAVGTWNGGGMDPFDFDCGESRWGVEDGNEEDQ
jgi:hypothetical protein